MTVLFVSDLHLDAARPAATHCFLHFLQGEALTAERLYILGDLFEVWVGDDDPDPHHRTVRDALAAYTAQGKLCYFMHGNRDFMLGPDFMQATGLIPLHDPTLISVDGTSIIISHGDLLCTDDRSYQRFRRIVRNALVQRIYRGLPFSLRQRIAGQARRSSQAASSAKSPVITDVNSQAVTQIMQTMGVNRLLHGHTHRPAIHRFELEGQPAMRMVLGDWYEHGSVLAWQDGRPELRKLPFAVEPQAG